MRSATRWSATAIAPLALALLPQAGWCVFMCKPPGGSTIIRDTPPPECASVEIRELNPDGSFKRIIPPPPTGEQRKLEQEKQKHSAECDLQNEAQKREDETLVRRYPLEDDLIVARDRALANEKAKIDQQTQRLKDLRQARARLEESKASYKGRSVPDGLKVDLDANESNSATVEHQIEAMNAGLAHLNEKYETDLKRYRELVRGTAKMPCSGG